MSELRELRTKAGYGLEEAARLLGIGETTLWRYETGKTKKRDHEVVKRMQALYAKPKAPAAS